MQIIDADGHVNDRPHMDEISKFMPAGNRQEVFPAFDHIHFHYLEGGEKESIPAVAPAAAGFFVGEQPGLGRSRGGNRSRL
ncbi:MAG: hypothetical protein FJ145_07590 [Deltaproteobacteria bacterium]|nr:hypothetical protein [Deltaproteobacteria bacterium]